MTGFDIAVIGKGLFGAATARHLSRCGLNTVVVGPDEPASGESTDLAEYQGPFGAHFDEARIIVARGDDASVALTELALDGMLSLETAVGSPLVVQSGALEITSTSEGETTLLDGVVAVPHGAQIVAEPPPQGYCNPRRYIAAALEDTLAHGGAIIRDVVESLASDRAGFLLRCRGSREIAARRVVVAAGAWSNHLLNRPLALRRKQETVLFARLSDATAAGITMRPTVIHGLTGRVESIYTLPPLPYPDGQWYLKLGANTVHDQEVEDGLIDDWYRSGTSDVALVDLSAAFQEVFPSVTVEAFHTERCVITYTTHGRPYVDQIESSGVFVAVGGNGHGASWADGVGALTAHLVGGDDWGDLPDDAFSATYADEATEWPEPLLLKDRLT